MTAVRPRQAVILAGGRGIRMRPFSDEAPKHMYPFHGRPFAAWLVDQLRDQGFERILFLLGYRPEATRKYFGDAVEYDVTPAAWESGSRLTAALPKLEDTFLLCYCDNIWPLRMIGLWQSWQRAGTLAQVVVYDNLDRYTRSNVEVGQASACGGLQPASVKRYDPERVAPGLQGVEIGYALLHREVANIGLADLAARGELAAYVTSHRYYSVGSPDRLAATEAYLSGRKTLLLDRDGVLNRRPPPGDYVKSWDEWEWLPGALDALVRFHRAGYRLAIVSNQPGVARGVMTAEALSHIEDRLRAETNGAIDAIYTCTHHWDAGCNCRKPKPGLLFAAQRDFHLNLSDTWFLGDDERDAQAAEAAGCLFAFVSERTPLSAYADSWLAKEKTCASS